MDLLQKILTWTKFTPELPTKNYEEETFWRHKYEDLRKDYSELLHAVVDLQKAKLRDELFGETNYNNKKSSNHYTSCYYSLMELKEHHLARKVLRDYERNCK